MLRSILGIRLKDKTSLVDIYKKTKAKRVRGVAELLKLRYAGHVVRESRQKWNHKMTTWVPHMGKRKRGRPKTRWSDEIVKGFGASWMNRAKDRQTWKGLVGAYAQKWAVEGADS